MNYTDRLADFMATLHVDDIPPDIRRLARVNMMDGIGVIVAGQAFLEHESDFRLKNYISLQSGAGQSTALGFNQSLSMQNAGFVNGSLSEVLDWQDTTMPARLHSGSGTVPAVLAAGACIRV